MVGPTEDLAAGLAAVRLVSAAAVQCRTDCRLQYPVWSRMCRVSMSDRANVRLHTSHRYALLLPTPESVERDCKYQSTVQTVRGVYPDLVPAGHVLGEPVLQGEQLVTDRADEGLAGAAAQVSGYRVQWQPLPGYGGVHHVEPAAGRFAGRLAAAGTAAAAPVL